MWHFKHSHPGICVLEVQYQFRFYTEQSVDVCISVSCVVRTIKTAISGRKAQRVVWFTQEVWGLHFCSLYRCSVSGMPSFLPLSYFLSFVATGLADVSVLYILVSWNKNSVSYMKAIKLPFSSVLTIILWVWVTFWKCVANLQFNRSSVWHHFHVNLMIWGYKIQVQ